MRISTRIASALAICLLAGVPRIASAADSTWAQTLDAPAVAAHVWAQGGHVVVLTAGSRSNALRQVASALRDEIDESRTAASVEIAEATQAQAGLDDARLLAALDVDAQRVAIVRVSGDEDAQRVTVSVYTPEGTAIGGFSAARGDTIEPPPQRSHAGGSDLAVITSGTIEQGDEALAQYERKRVIFDGALEVTANGSSGATISRGFEPKTGAGAPLPADEYYTYIGREDLAQEYRRRRGARIGLVTTGSLAALTGLTLMMALPIAAIAKGDDCSSIDDPMTADACTAAADARQKSQVRRGLGIGGGLLGGGIVMAAIGGRINPHTSTAAEIEEMGSEYNRELRNRLGVSGMAVRGSAHRRGGGVVLSGRF